MSLRRITERAGEWLRGAGLHSDIVISSRIRYARNLAGSPFVNRANPHQCRDVLERCREHVVNDRLAENIIWVDLPDSSPLDRRLLVERHLISSQHAAAEGLPRAVAFDPEETFAIMINEEDHLRLQVLRSGIQLTTALQQIDHIDDMLEQQLDYAFTRRFGYLTACPSNVGTGIRVSVMLHLPALKLTGEIRKVHRAARDMHLAVRGWFGEGSEARGHLYQISNRTTLGKSENEILADFEHIVVPRIIACEQQARQTLLNQSPAQLDDKFRRAWDVLTNARVLDIDEALQLLSHLRLGVNMGRIQKIDIRVINELFLLAQPAHLQRVMGREMDVGEQAQARAPLIRERLEQAGG